MLLGPTVLIVLRVYLQIYVEHSDRLDRLAQSVSIVRTPTLVPLRNPLIRVLSGLTFYLLLPVAMMLFAWKAAVFPAWGSGLLCIATGVVVSHVMLPFSRFSWRTKALLSITAAIIAGAVILGFGPPRRQFNLFHANLSGQWLHGDDLRIAYLTVANLSGTNLGYADLTRANLGAANLTDANLTGANLHGASLSDANLSGANLQGASLGDAQLFRAKLSGANLSGAYLGGAKLNSADLSGADLSGARDLTQLQLDEACGNASTKLRGGLTLKSCPTDQAEL
jgi:hypothetical protein